MKKKIDHNYKTDFWPKRIMESLNWSPFLDVTEFTADKINYDKNLFPSLLKSLHCLRLYVGGIKKKEMIKNELYKKLL